MVITKTDLADPEPFLQNFAGLDIPVVRSSQLDFPIAELTPMLAGHTTVAVGHSGVGKSTLVNALVPGTDRAVGVVNEVTGRGRHTSSSTVSLRVPTGGWIIDTPGVRSFGLGHVNPTTSCGRSPTSPRSRWSARATAATSPTPPTARSTRPSPRAASAPSASTRCGACSVR